MKIAVTGSTGAIATDLIASLQPAGHEVLRMIRGPRSSPASVWDPASNWIREGVLEGCDAIVHLGGASIGEGRWTKKRKAELRSSRIDSTRLLVDHVKQLTTPPKTLVCASAVGFYGDGGTAELTEDSPRGEGFLADLVVDWEAAADAGIEAGMRVVKLRFAPLMDPSHGLLQKMLLTLKFGFGVQMGNGKQYLSWVTPRDAVRAIEFALNQDIEGPFNVTAPGPVTNREFTKTLGRVKRRRLVLPGPGFMMKLTIGGAAQELMLTGQNVTPKRLADAGFAQDPRR